MSEEAQWMQDAYAIKDAIKVLKARAHITDRDVEAIQECCDNKGWLSCEDFICKYYKAFDERGYSFVCTRAKEGQKKYYYTSKPPEFCHYWHEWSWKCCEYYEPVLRNEEENR